jgi:anthranilate synthase/aminodeoxychorismate synthase-like glutamine amidotransferase
MSALDVLLVDHQDSFTWNLAHAIGAFTGALPSVVDSRAVEPARVAAAPPDLLVLGPGPGHPAVPRDAARSLELLRALPVATPVFGVCFGLQLIVTAAGGEVVRARAPVHGKSSTILHDGTGPFRGLAAPARMMRYHSLVADRTTLPSELIVTARSPEGEVMAIAHRERPLWAVQFHPESVGSPDGTRLIENVLELAQRASARTAAR